MATKETVSVERTYTIPLRREYLKAPPWNRSKKAKTAVQEFIRRHMKTTEVKIKPALNEEIWKHGIKNPPPRVKVTASKDEKGAVQVDLFGAKENTPKVSKAAPAPKVSAIEAKTEQKAEA